MTKRTTPSRVLVDEAEVVQRPGAEDELAHDLLFGHATDRRAARINRHRAVVAHHEDAVFRHLVWQLDVALAKRLVGHVWLV